VASLMVGSTGTAVASDDSGWKTKSVVTGLKLPRGIAFDRAGSMYVAETGLPGTDPFGATNTGAVDRYVFDDSAPHRVWSTPFLSVFSNGAHGSEAEGPEGLSSVPTRCSREDRSRDSRGDSPGRSGCKVLMIMGNSQQGIVAQGGPSLPQVGHLYELDTESGAATDRGNIGDQDYSWTNDHSSLFSDFPDANPYGVVATKGADKFSRGDDSASNSHTYVVDAASNTVDEVSSDGNIRVVAYIPNEAPIPGLPTRDASPTCAAQGPDGALYVGTLDLIRNFSPGQGFSHVYRVDPRAHENYLTAAHLWASGLTDITSCAFDSEGNFWATEMFKNNPAGPPGDVVRIPFRAPKDVEHIGGGQLPFPGGIAEGADNAMYVTVNSAGTTLATGAVVRVSQEED
jgi:hypothetical protein